VVVKEIKRTSYACDICKRRKGKCSGTYPCTYCVDHKIECTYLKANKKRGPVKKLKSDKSPDENSSVKESALVQSDAPRPSFLESALCNDVEQFCLVDLFVDYFSPGFFLPGESTRNKLLHPETEGAKLMSVSVLAYMSRTCGQFSRSEQYMGEARGLAGSLLDEKSADVAMGYMALSRYFPVSDHRHSLYTNIAHSISKYLRRESVEEIRVYTFSGIDTVLQDPTLDADTKLKRLNIYVPTIMSLKDATAADMLVAVILKLCCALLPKSPDLSQIMLAIKDTTLTSEEANTLLADVQILEWLLTQNNDMTKAKNKYRLALKALKMVIYWMNGNLPAAFTEANSAYELGGGDDLKCYFTSNPLNLFVLVMFFARMGQVDKARKIFNNLEIICKYLGQQESLYCLPTVEALAGEGAGGVKAPDECGVEVASPTSPPTVQLSESYPVCRPGQACGNPPEFGFNHMATDSYGFLEYLLNNS